MPYPLQDYAYRKLGEWICSGKLKPGQLYSELTIGKQLNISRTPVRAALQHLEADGWVIRLPQRGFYVYQFDEKDVEELFELRKALEGYAIEFIFDHRDRINLDKLPQHLKVQAKEARQRNFKKFMREDVAFHESLIKATRNKRMVDLYTGLRHSIEIAGLHLIMMEREDCRQLIKEHTSIMEGLLGGDPVRAKEALYQHLDTAKRLLTESMRK